MCCNFVNIMYKDNDCTRNIQTGKDECPVFKFENQMQEQINNHEQNWNGCRV